MLFVRLRHYLEVHYLSSIRVGGTGPYLLLVPVLVRVDVPTTHTSTRRNPATTYFEDGSGGVQLPPTYLAALGRY